MYRGLTPGRAALRFLFPCVFGASFVVGAVTTIDRGGLTLLAVGSVLFGGSAYGLFRGVRNAGKSLEAIVAEESGLLARAHDDSAEPGDAPYRAAALANRDEPAIDLDRLPLPNVHLAAGQVLPVRLTRIESRRHEVGSLIAVQAVLATFAGGAWVAGLHGSFGAVVAAVLASIVAVAVLLGLVHKVRAFRVPEPIVEIDAEPATLGGPIEVRVAQPGPSPGGDLEVTLRCEEITIVSGHKRSTTYRELLSDGLVAVHPIPPAPAGGSRELRGSVLVPRAPASFAVPGMRVEWTIVVRLRRGEASPSEDKFLLRVLPRAPGGAA